jgi:spore coat protein U-like protein
VRSVSDMKNFVYSAAALALLASGGAVAQQTLTDDINVTAVVTAACTSVTATDVDFGSAAAADVNQDDQTSTITVTCDTGTAWTVEIDYGMNPVAGTPPIRNVTSSVAPSAGERMDYYIFSDAGRTTTWGTTADGDNVVTGTGTGAADPLTAYFRLVRTSGNSPGTYTDLVTVTMTF